MEAFDKEKLTDDELAAVLAEWKVPDAPARLRAGLFPEASRPWWRRIWGLPVRLPLPAACAVLLALFALGRWTRPIPPKPSAPQIVVKTERVEVPVVKERVIYRDVPAAEATAAPGKLSQWKPVAALRPRIIRSGQHEN